MMKSIMFFLFISLNIYADTEEQCLQPHLGSTNHYEESFCGCAQTYMKNVKIENEVSNDEISNINKLKEQIKMLKAIEAIRNNYVTSFKNLSSSPYSGANLKNYNTALVSGALLKTIDGFFKDKDNADQLSKGTFDFKKYCLDSKNSIESICRIRNDSKLSNLFGFLSDSIDKFVVSYKLATGDQNKTKFDEAIKSLVESIPEDMDPKIVYESLQKVSPESKDKLDNINKFAIECAFKGIESSCKKEFLLNEDKSNQLAEAITFTKSESENAEKLFKNVQLKNVEESIKTKISEKMSKVFNSDISGKREDLINSFTNNVSDLQFDSSLVDQSAVSEFKSNCGKEKLNNNNSTEEVYQCFEKLDKLFNQLTQSKDIKQFENELSEAQSKLKNKVKENNPNNLLKKYIASKYIRQCHDKNTNVTSKTVEISECGNKTTQIISNLNIAGQTFQIVGKLSADSGEYDLMFSKAEMKEFEKACPKTNVPKEIDSICKTLAQQNAKTKAAKDSKYWDTFHENYYVNYDKSAPGGYTAVEKKSNGKIFAEGALMGVVQFLPSALSLYAQGTATDALAQQAIWQKQWMSDMNIINNAYLNNIYFPTMLGGIQTTVSGFNFGASGVGTSTLPTSTPSTSVFKGFSF